MASIKASQVKELREASGAGMMDCKKALVECGGDMAAAMELLQKKAAAKAVKRMDRDAAEGMIASYIHGAGRIGVMVELNCETDFVARNEDFQKLARELCLHVAATGSRYVNREEIPEADRTKQSEIFLAQAIESGKPEAIAGKIVEGRLRKWYEEVCLEDQAWFRDADMTVKEVLQNAIAKLGENMKVRRIVRWELGEAV